MVLMKQRLKYAEYVLNLSEQRETKHVDGSDWILNRALGTHTCKVLADILSEQRQTWHGLTWL